VERSSLKHTTNQTVVHWDLQSTFAARQQTLGSQQSCELWGCSHIAHNSRKAGATWGVLSEELELQMLRLAVNVETGILLDYGVFGVFGVFGTH
jgi:hypothetical protein